MQSKMSFEFLLNFTSSSGMKQVFNYRRRRSHTLQYIDRPLHGDASSSFLIFGNDQRQDEITLYYHVKPSQISRVESNVDVGSQGDNAYQTDVSDVQRMVKWLDNPLFAQMKQLWSVFRDLMGRSFQTKQRTVEEQRQADANV